MKYCNNRDTRKNLYEKFSTRAYPENNILFNTIRDKKHLRATLVGYDNFIACDLEDVMAKEKKQVEKLLADVNQATHNKAMNEKQDLENFAKELFIKMKDKKDINDFLTTEANCCKCSELVYGLPRTAFKSGSSRQFGLDSQKLDVNNSL